jgi:hypothetical protein
MSKAPALQTARAFGAPGETRPEPTPARAGILTRLNPEFSRDFLSSNPSFVSCLGEEYDASYHAETVCAERGLGDTQHRVQVAAFGANCEHLARRIGEPPFIGCDRRGLAAGLEHDHVGVQIVSLLLAIAFKSFTRVNLCSPSGSYLIVIQRRRFPMPSKRCPGVVIIECICFANPSG